MIKNIFKSWLKTITISLVIVFSFLILSPVNAAASTSSQTGMTLNLMSADLADGGSGLAIGKVIGDSKVNDSISKRPLGELIMEIVNYFLGFLGLLAVLVFVYAGVLWVVNGGSEDQISKAKTMMTYAALGLIIVMLSFSIVTFITNSVGGGNVSSAQTCSNTSECSGDEECVGGLCLVSANGQLCDDDNPCPSSYSCESGACTYDGYQGSNACFGADECQQGWYCSPSSKSCLQGTDQTCTNNEDCGGGKICDLVGYCRNPSAGSNTVCSDNTDCPSNFVCNGDTNRCEYQGGGSSGSISGSPTKAAADENFNEIDDLMNDLGDDIQEVIDDIEGLPTDVKKKVENILKQGTLDDKKARIEELIDQSDDPIVIKALENLVDVLNRFHDIRKELDLLKEVMPESKDILEAWSSSSESLDALIDEPLNMIRYRRFEKNYKKLKNLIMKFPVVQAVIRATPASGNVPFTVTLNALDSLDPTGGTISDYKWSFLDNSGSLVSLGNNPVIVHEFKDPNTYSVRLQVSTSNVDKDGYKTAMDGVSYVRIKANIPSSQVKFKINGNDVDDVYHATLEEAEAGLSFDPTPTVPTLGRTVQKYEWFYGDSTSESRTNPTTVVHSYKKSGEYFATLKVKDSHGVTDKSVIKIFVKSLAADIQISPKGGNVNTEFKFKGIESRSDNGAIKEYEWMIQDIEGHTIVESKEQSFSHSFDGPGKYKAILLVTDTTGAKDKYLKVFEIYSRPPVANFSHKIPETNHPNRVEFNAINSHDPDEGDRIKYSWDFDGDGSFEVVDSNDIKVTHSYVKVGEYRAVLQVEDLFGQRKQSEKKVSVDSILSGDISLASRVTQVGEEVVFTADSPNSEAYLWEFGDGETSSTETVAVKYKYQKKGKYKVNMNFFDKEDNSNVDSTYLLVGDADEPVAAVDYLINGRRNKIIDDLCGRDKHGIEVSRTDTIAFSAKNSINRDGSSRMLSYDWKFSDGMRNSNKEFTHRFDEVNTSDECFSLGLVVRDKIGGKISEEDTVYLKVINQVPHITDFVISSEVSKELISPTKVKLRVVNPKDFDGQIKKYRWWYYQEGNEDDKIGVHTTASPETEIVITAEGQSDVLNRYFFVVELTDNNNGVYNSMERFGEVSYVDVKNGPNLSPVAEFAMDKTTISVGDSVTFISQSYDPQGDILPNDAYKWDFDGDGEFDDVSTGPQVNRQFNTPGEYQVRLKVLHRGLSSSATKTIYVEPTNSLPQAAFTYKVNGTEVVFDSGSSRYDPDLDDITLRYEWDFDVMSDANGNGIKDDDVESTEPNPSFTYSELRTYRVKLKTKDSIGMEGVVVRDINLAMNKDELAKNTYTSLSVDSDSKPLTTMNVVVAPVNLKKGGTSDIFVEIANADNSPYSGKVFFEVLDGSGEFTPNPSVASNSTASTVFSAIDKGSVRIRVRATGTYYGELEEEISFKVK